MSSTDKTKLNKIQVYSYSSTTSFTAAIGGYMGAALDAVSGSWSTYSGKISNIGTGGPVYTVLVGGASSTYQTILMTSYADVDGFWLASKQGANYQVRYMGFNG